MFWSVSSKSHFGKEIRGNFFRSRKESVVEYMGILSLIKDYLYTFKMDNNA